MRSLPSLAAATLAAALSATASAQAGDTATRCGQYGCDQIHCNYTGDRCVRYSDYDSYYNGYTNGYDRNGYYGGYGAPEGAYSGYGSYYGSGPQPGYGYYGGYGGEHLVCDNDGDRCYRSSMPYWNYREYYRIHGYHWDEGYWER